MTKRNENRLGYKKTRVGWMPEEWVVKPLDEFGSFLKGKGIPNSEKRESGVPCITYGEIYTKHDFVIKDFYSFTSKETAKASQRIEKNCILFAGSGETLDEIGKCVAYTKDIEAYAGGDIIIFTPKDVNSIYLSYSLNSELLIRQKRKLGQGHSVVHIYSGGLKTLHIPLPPQHEQKKIAEILSAWDQAIEQMGKLIDAKERLKKGLMQQLLTGKRRLPGFYSPFKTVKLNKIISLIQRPTPKPKQPYDAMGIRSHFKGTFAKHVEDPEKVAMDVLYTANSSDLIVNITFAWEGAIAIVPPEHDGRLVSHRFPTYIPNNTVVSIDYLRYLITQERFKYLLAGISPGGAGRNRVMSKKDFLKLKVALPDVTEQNMIANILDTASRELELLQAKTDALREQKKGLMQQLLTGKKRIAY